MHGNRHNLGDNKPFTAKSLSFPVFFWELGN